jgi:hypothetical protein
MPKSRGRKPKAKKVLPAPPKIAEQKVAKVARLVDAAGLLLPKVQHEFVRCQRRRRRQVGKHDKEDSLDQHDAFTASDS